MPAGTGGSPPSLWPSSARWTCTFFLDLDAFFVDLDFLEELGCRCFPPGLQETTAPGGRALVFSWSAAG